MKSLLEKLKSLDKNKKILVGVGAAVVLVAVIAVIALAVSGGDGAEASSAVDSSVVSENSGEMSNVISAAESDASGALSDIESDLTSSETSVDESLESSDVESDVSAESDESAVSSEDVSETESSEAETSSEYVEDSSESTESSEAEASSEPVEESSESVESSEYIDESEPEDSSEEPTYSSEPDESSEPSNESSEPVDESSEPEEPSTEDSSEEYLGEGSEDNPILQIPDGETMTVTTVEIPAGDSRFYAIYRVGGMYLNISDSDAYVVYDGKTYTASNGKVSFKIDNALASEAIIFEIGNSGSSATAFEIVFKNPTGSFANPTVLDGVGEEITVSLEAGADTGHYYKYIAEKSGTLRFYMTATVDSVLMATNNRNSAQRSTEADVLTDENGLEYIELEVEAGDEIIINVGAIPTRRGKYPATEITWKALYS